MDSRGSRQKGNFASRELAERVARDIVGCDDSILSLLVIDSRQGKILAVARSSRLGESEYATPDIIEKFGTLAMLVWGAAGNATDLLGKREYLIGAFRSQLILLANLQQYEMIAALRLNRSSNPERVYKNLTEILGV
jgi:hypothetical protein